MPRRSRRKNAVIRPSRRAALNQISDPGTGEEIWGYRGTNIKVRQRPDRLWEYDFEVVDPKLAKRSEGFFEATGFDGVRHPPDRMGAIGVGAFHVDTMIWMMEGLDPDNPEDDETFERRALAIRAIKDGVTEVAEGGEVLDRPTVARALATRLGSHRQSGTASREERERIEALNEMSVQDRLDMINETLWMENLIRPEGRVRLDNRGRAVSPRAQRLRNALV